MGEPTVKLDSRAEVVRVELDGQVWVADASNQLWAAADMLKMAADRDATAADLREADRQLAEVSGTDAEGAPLVGLRAWPMPGNRVEVQFGPDLPVMLRQDTAEEWAAEMAEAADELAEAITANAAAEAADSDAVEQLGV